MSKNLRDLHNIGPKQEEVLKLYGIDSPEKLLAICGNRFGRKGLAEKASINEENILSWVNMCDLLRINGIAGQITELLEASGVNTLNHLCGRNADTLALMMADANEEKRLCKATPGPNTVSGWIDQARQLKSMVTH